MSRLLLVFMMHAINKTINPASFWEIMESEGESAIQYPSSSREIRLSWERDNNAQESESWSDSALSLDNSRTLDKSQVPVSLLFLHQARLIGTITVHTAVPTDNYIILFHAIANIINIRDDVCYRWHLLLCLVTRWMVTWLLSFSSTSSLRHRLSRRPPLSKSLRFSPFNQLY